jgi:hypothetical protein
MPPRSPLTGFGLALVGIALLEMFAAGGWPPPLPAAWSLVTVAAVVRLAGMAAGGWAACAFAGYAAYTAGFTVGHASDLLVWGRPSSRVVTFCVAAFALVGIAGWTGQAAGASRSSQCDVVRTVPEPNAEGQARIDLSESTRRALNDLNNQLFVIRGVCELVSDEQTPAAHALQLALAVDAVDACARVTGQLMAAIERDAPA